MKKFYRRLSSKLSSRNTKTQPDNVPVLPPTVPSTDPSALGLKILHEDEDADIDIIALHGQNGHPVDSWTERESGVLWLRDLLPEELGAVTTLGYQREGKMREEAVDERMTGLKQGDGLGKETNTLDRAGAERKGFKLRVLSYGYGGKEEAEKIAAGLMRDVEGVRGGEALKRTIIWIAHSFGGPILKAAISTLPSSSPLLTATQAILFFGVAQNIGFESLSMIETLPDDVLNVEMRKMRKEGMWLRNGEEEFEKLEKRKAWRVIWFREIAEGGGKIPAGTEDEDRTEDGTRNELRKEDEERESRVIRLGKTHGAMVRFATRDDEDFRKVVRCLRDIVQGD